MKIRSNIYSIKSSIRTTTESLYKSSKEGYNAGLAEAKRANCGAMKTSYKVVSRTSQSIYKQISMDNLPFVIMALGIISPIPGSMVVLTPISFGLFVGTKIYKYVKNLHKN